MGYVHIELLTSEINYGSLALVFSGASCSVAQKYSGNPEVPQTILNTVFCYLIFGHLKSLCSEPVKTHFELSFFCGGLYRNPVLAPWMTPGLAQELWALRNKGNAVSYFPIRRIPWEAHAATLHNSAGTLGVFLVPVLMFSSQFSPWRFGKHNCCAVKTPNLQLAFSS